MVELNIQAPSTFSFLQPTPFFLQPTAVQGRSAYRRECGNIAQSLRNELLLRDMMIDVLHPFQDLSYDHLLNADDVEHLATLENRHPTMHCPLSLHSNSLYEDETSSERTSPVAENRIEPLPP